MSEKYSKNRELGHVPGACRLCGRFITKLFFLDGTIVECTPGSRVLHECNPSEIPQTRRPRLRKNGEYEDQIKLF